MHESQMHRFNCFITLTYSEENYEPSLKYRDWQLFMKKMRWQFGPARFFMCGEYGELNLRPHFHAVIFGLSFLDREQIGKDLYRSKTLDELWGKGHATVGECTHESAGYVAGYCVKKVNGELADRRYSRVDLRTGEVVRVDAEFGRCSLRPGIGATWFEKYWKEVYSGRDGVVLRGGRTVPAPKYYDRLLKVLDEDLSDFKSYERYVRSEKFVDDCSVDRLKIREEVSRAKFRMKERSL